MIPFVRTLISRYSALYLILALLVVRYARAGEPTKPLPSIGLTRITTQRVPHNKLQSYPIDKILVAENLVAPGRYVLVPVVVTNCWDSIPIYSFHLGVEYDYQAMHAVGVEKAGPGTGCTQNVGLANDFTITFSDASDASGPGVSPHRIIIDGSSSIPLKLTTPPGNDCRQSDTVDLLYIKFLVTAHSGDVPSSSLLRIPNDVSSLSWGAYSPLSLFPIASSLDSHLGLCGPEFIDATGTVQQGANSQGGRGLGNLVITKQPGIDLSPNAEVVKLDAYNYAFYNLIYADPGTTTPSSRLITILDSVADTRMKCLTIQSNAPWLTIGNNPFSGSTAYAVNPDLDYTRNQLLRKQDLYVIADNNYFISNMLLENTPGIYTGVISFTSDEAGNSPTNLVVNFISQPSDISVYNDPGQTSAVVHYPVAPVSSDGSYVLSYNPPSGTAFPAGATPVVLTITNRAGVAVTRTFTVTVIEEPSAIRGIVYSDDDNNGARNGGEQILAGVVGEILPASGFPIAFTSGADGSYAVHVTPGAYTVSIPYPPLYRTVNPSSRAVTITQTLGEFSTGNDFGLYTNPGHHDLKITLTAAESPRPGHDEPCYLDAENIGTAAENAGVTFAHDANVTLSSASCTPPYDSYNAATFVATWNPIALAPGAHRTILVAPTVLTSVVAGTVLSLTTSVSAPIGEETPIDNTSESFPIVVNSYDPNDKQVFPGGDVSPAMLATGPWLTYTIRFQNTGTANAIDVVLRDTLSKKVIASTVQTLSSSHPCTMHLTGAGEIHWDFPGINLPPKATSEPLSHGFVTYRVMPKSSLMLNDVILNTASIYFDFNPAIVTNTTSTAIAAKWLITREDSVITTSYAFSDPHIRGRSFIVLNNKLPFSPITRVDIQFVSRPSFAPVGSGLLIDGIAHAWDSPFAQLHAGPAAIRAIAFDLGVKDSANWTGNVVITAHHLDGDSSRSSYGPWTVSTSAIGTSGSSVNGFALVGIDPNPATRDATVRYALGAVSHAVLEIVNALGQSVAVIDEGTFAAGPHTTLIPTGMMSSGTYWVRLSTARGVFVLPLIVTH